METPAHLCHTKHVINRCKRSPPARAKERTCKCFVLDDTSGLWSSKGTTYGNKPNSLKKKRAGGMHTMIPSPSSIESHRGGDYPYYRGEQSIFSVSQDT